MADFTTPLPAENTDPWFDDIVASWDSLTDFVNAVNHRIPAETADTAADYKVIMFSNGTVRAVPIDTAPPPTPTGFSAVATVSKVALAWSASAGATQYEVYRDGSWLATTGNLRYADWAVNPGSTHSYQVRALNAYSMASAFTTSASVFVDPSLNSPPTVVVTAWPTVYQPGQKQLIRVCASDVDAQILALTLGVSAGSLEPTADPSAWLLSL